VRQKRLKLSRSSVRNWRLSAAKPTDVGPSVDLQQRLSPSARKRKNTSDVIFFLPLLNDVHSETADVEVTGFDE
jgi:hypothetical protein